MAEEPMEVAATETSEDKSIEAVTESQPQQTGEAEASGDNESKETPTKTDESGKKVYTEEERLKRKAYFKEMREKKRLARERYNKQNTKRTLVNSKPRNIQPKLRPREDVAISFNMTQEEDKVLEFYKVKLSALKSTNEQLHKRLAYLVKENMRLLQMGPPTKNV